MIYNKRYRRRFRRRAKYAPLSIASNPRRQCSVVCGNTASLHYSWTIGLEKNETNAWELTKLLEMIRLTNNIKGYNEQYTYCTLNKVVFRISDVSISRYLSYTKPPTETKEFVQPRVTPDFEILQSLVSKDFQEKVFLVMKYDNSQGDVDLLDIDQVPAIKPKVIGRNRSWVHTYYVKPTNRMLTSKFNDTSTVKTIYDGIQHKCPLPRLFIGPAMDNFGLTATSKNSLQYHMRFKIHVYAYITFSSLQFQMAT